MVLFYRGIYLIDDALAVILLAPVNDLEKPYISYIFASL